MNLKRVVIGAVMIETRFQRIVSNGKSVVRFCRCGPGKRWISRTDENPASRIHGAVANKGNYVHRDKAMGVKTEKKSKEIIVSISETQKCDVCDSEKVWVEWLCHVDWRRRCCRRGKQKSSISFLLRTWSILQGLKVIIHRLHILVLEYFILV